MKRIAKTFYTTDDDKSLLSLAGGKAYVERTYSAYSADELEELAVACRAAAEELRTLALKGDLDASAANRAYAEKAS